jgi:hypothetical protein
MPMGRLACLFLLTVIVATVGGKQQSLSAAAHGDPPKQVIKAFSGIVAAVTQADPEREIPSQIVAANDAGRRSSFLVTTTTTIYGPAWNVMELGQIVSGDRVKIRYVTTSEGLNVARSIHQSGR